MWATDRWRVDDHHESLWLVRRSPWGNAGAAPEGSSSAEAEAEALPAAAAVARVISWFPTGWTGNERLLAEICLSLEGVFPASDVPDADWLHGTVRRALLDGRLVALRMRFPAAVEGFAKDEEEPPAPPREVRAEKTWIEIELVDDDDPPKPMAFKRYRVELPDGSVREAMLDANGMAWLTGIDPGECQVRFPDFDSRDWGAV